MKEIKIGCSGIGNVSDVEDTFFKFKEAGISAAEIPFTYGIFIKKKEDIEKVRKASEKFGVALSIHAPYWINLNSAEKIKIEGSKKRILDCCEIGEKLGVKFVVFHAGFYGKISKEETYENIKNQIIEMQGVIKKNNWKVKLAPETMGKINVFGSVSEILKLVKDTKCSFTLDFAHLYARSLGTLSYKEMLSEFNEIDKFHCHFSGIEFGDKGEKNHKLTSEQEWTKLLKVLKESGKEFTIINESPSPVEDALLGVEVLRGLG
ncbi:MAG: TIM barrel protein [Candidatus Pacearchaeota archaeon]